MHASRPQKETIRNIWAGVVSGYADSNPGNSDAPLFLTLSGAEGRDIETLVDHGILRRTETGAIDARDLTKVVAIESSPDAELALKNKFPGLRTYLKAFQDLVRGTSSFNFPEGQERKACRARVVNLDLTKPLHGEIGGSGELHFPILTWIRKLCQIHTESPRRDWCLCLTLNAQVPWPQEICSIVSSFLIENFESEPEFLEAAEEALGGETIRIISQPAITFSSMPPDIQQRLLMLFVPKKIAQLVHADGWQLQTDYNLQYGAEGEAQMVTFVFRLLWDSRFDASPRAVYRDSLLSTFSLCGRIDEAGNIIRN